MRRVARGRSGDKVAPVVPVAPVAVLVVALMVPGSLRAQVPPDEAWRSVETSHFRVTFPAHLEFLGREAAARAERAFDRLSDAFVEPPTGRTEILVTDHVDVSNGFARVAPYKQVVVYAHPPVDGFALSHFDDWLEVVLIHELAHVFHLDRTGPLGEILRSVFGRVPLPWPFFPQFGTPGWTIEGLATWYESALSASGRVHGSQHAMIVRTAILEGRFEGLDQASGESPAWPAGQRPYVYGSLFFDHLLARHGPERMATFVEAVGRQLVPYRLNAAAERAFGVSFEEAWDAWRADLTAEVRELEERLRAHAPLTSTEPVTRGARMALHARVSPDGRTLVYARSDGRSDPQLRLAAPSGAGSDRLVRTNGVATSSFTPDGRVVYAQLEAADAYRRYGDLFVTDLEGDVRRITREARLDHPSVTPDGREAVAIQSGEGTTRLVAVDLATGEVRPLVPFRTDVHWAFPAVSPDGRWVAAARWTPGAYFDVVVVDRDGRVVAEVTRDRALDTAPTWSPDGRWLLWASDRSGILNVLAAPVDPGTGLPRGGEGVRQATHLTTGAHFPAVSPDGRWLYASVHHADGWELERLPFDPGRWIEPFPPAARFSGSHVVSADDPPATGGLRLGDAEEVPALDAPDVAEVAAVPDQSGVGETSGYSPLRTLVPRYWQPLYIPSIQARGTDVIGPSYGVTTAGQDLVGRHRFDARALVSTSDARFSGSVGYGWAGLGNPVFAVRGSQSWDAFGPFVQEVEGEARTLFLDERERSASVSATVVRPAMRSRLSLTLAGGMVWERRRVLEADLEVSDELSLARPGSRLSDFRATVGLSTARPHAFSVGLEDGVAAFVTGRTRHELDVPAEDRDRPGGERSVDELFGQLRVYEGVEGLPGYADHVLALRASAGAARGPGADPFHFDVGGTGGLGDPVFGILEGRGYFFPARGFVNGDRSGRHAWSATAEWRVPLALVNRGLGLLPLHLDRVSGHLFVDAANAWGPELPGVPGFDNPRRTTLSSAGAEVVAETLTFFSIPVALRGGVAWRLTGGDGSAFYLRIGRSF